MLFILNVDLKLEYLILIYLLIFTEIKQGFLRLYAQADGAMLLTDGGYKENKLGRIFRATALKATAVEERSAQIESSLFMAHLGSATDFVGKLRPHLDGYKVLGANLVFISDGAIWLRQFMQTHYPQATLSLTTI